jgi:Sec-independent protein secretion pathway component TatC
MLAMPLWLLYEAGIVVAAWGKRNGRVEIKS